MNELKLFLFIYIQCLKQSFVNDRQLRNVCERKTENLEREKIE